MSKKDDMVAALQKNLDEVKKTSEELSAVDSLIAVGILTQARVDEIVSG